MQIVWSGTRPQPMIDFDALVDLDTVTLLEDAKKCLRPLGSMPVGGQAAGAPDVRTARVSEKREPMTVPHGTAPAPTNSTSFPSLCASMGLVGDVDLANPHAPTLPPHHTTLWNQQGTDTTGRRGSRDPAATQLNDNKREVVAYWSDNPQVIARRR